MITKSCFKFEEREKERASASTTPAAPFKLTIEHPRLTETDAASIRTFLQKYEQYRYEVTSRTHLISGSDQTKTVRPVDIKFCVDMELLESPIDLGLIPGAASYNKITNEQVRCFLDDRLKESKETITLTKLDKIFKEELYTNMRSTDATARMQDLFAQCQTIVCRNKLNWIIEDSQKVAVGHVLSAIQPSVLKERLTSDFAFSQHNLKKNFQGFLKYEIELAKAFQLVDCDPR